MSAQMKGLLGVVLGLNSVYPVLIFELLGRPGIVLGLAIPFLLAVGAYYFGRQSKKWRI